MICPNCNYQHGYDVTRQEQINGEKGSFYTLPIKMEQESQWGSRTDTERVFGCPQCGQMFMDVL